MFQNKLATPYWCTYTYDPELEKKPIHTVTHSGQEFDMVVSGTMKIRVSAQMFVTHHVVGREVHTLDGNDRLRVEDGAVLDHVERFFRGEIAYGRHQGVVVAGMHRFEPRCEEQRGVLRGIARGVDEAAELRKMLCLIPYFLRKFALRHIQRTLALLDGVPSGNLQCPTVHRNAVLFDERNQS